MEKPRGNSPPHLVENRTGTMRDRPMLGNQRTTTVSFGVPNVFVVSSAQGKVAELINSGQVTYAAARKESIPFRPVDREPNTDSPKGNFSRWS